MFIEAVLLSGLILSGSKFYEKFMKPGRTKRDTDKKFQGSEKSLSYPLIEEKKLPDSKSPVEPADKTDPSEELARENQFNNITINKYFAVTSVSAVLTAAGRIFYPPLALWGAVGLFYPLTGIMKKAYEGLFKEKKVKMEVMGSILLPGMIFAGYYFTACFSYMLYFMSLKILNKIEDNTRQNLVGIFENQPRSVWIVKDSIEIEIPFDSLQTGDTLAVKAGETIPADGTVTEGMASIDQHILTGESQPLEKGAGEPVFASTVVLSGKIRIKVEKSGKDTVVANVADMINRTVDFKTTIQSKGERIADQSVLPTLALSAVALPVTGTVGALAVLNTFVGGDVYFLVPLSTLNFLKAAAENGILIKDGRSLELLGKTDTVVFDKTGTLTTDRLFVREIHTCEGYSETEILQYAAMAENRQPHPIAKAVLEKAQECGINPDNADDSSYEVGYGIRVKISETVIRVGSARFMKMEHIGIDEKINALMRDSAERGTSLVMVAKDSLVAGAVELSSSIRPEVVNIIKSLKKRQKSLYIITGDNENAAGVLAQELGIENYFSETFPEQKAEIIEQLQKEGRSVCFIGDGINDSIAMKKAHVSVSLRGASTIATDTANIILMDGTLRNLDRLFEIAEDFDKNINTALTLAIVPGVMNIGGIFLLHTGIYVAMGLYYIFLPLGVGNSFLPMIKYKKKEVCHEKRD